MSSYVCDCIDDLIPDLFNLHEDRLLGYGMHVLAFEYSRDKVFIVSKEYGKEKYLKNLRLNIEENIFPDYFSLELKKELLNLKSEFSYFVMDKLEEFDLYKTEKDSYIIDDYASPVISQVLRAISMYKSDSCLIPREFESVEELKKELPEILEYYKILCNEEFDNLSEKQRELDTMILKQALYNYQTYSMKVLRAVKKSLNAVINSKIEGSFVLDLHSDQFMLHNGDIICIDPVMFNYEPVFM